MADKLTTYVAGSRQDPGRRIDVTNPADGSVVVSIGDGAGARPVTVAYAPVGGVSQGGVGREGGHAGLEEFAKVRFLSIGGVV